MAQDKDITGFTRDPSLGAELAGQFAATAMNAEQLIEANAARMSSALAEAQLLDPDLEDDSIDKGGVASAADLDEENIVSFSKRGDDFVIYAYQDANGRVGKSVLHIGDKGKLEEIDESETPAQAQLRAQITARATLAEAQREAEKIVSEARAKAEADIQKAADKGEEQATEIREDAAKKAAKEAEAAEKGDAPGRSTGRRSTKPRRRSTGQKSKAQKSGKGSDDPAKKS